jgi:hypothetical protein
MISINRDQYRLHHSTGYGGLFEDYLKVMDVIVQWCDTDPDGQVRRDQIFAQIPDMSKEKINRILQHLKETGRVWEPFMSVFRILVI